MNDLSRFERNIDRMVASAVSGDIIWLDQREQLLKKIADLIKKEANRILHTTVPMSLSKLDNVLQESARGKKIKLTLSPSDGEARIKFYKDAPDEVIELVIRAMAQFKQAHGDEVLTMSYRGEIYITPINTVVITVRTEKHDKKISFTYSVESK